jgi:hypothetical protein
LNFALKAAYFPLFLKPESVDPFAREEVRAAWIVVVDVPKRQNDASHAEGKSKQK